MVWLWTKLFEQVTPSIPMTWLELVSNIIAIISVWYTIKQNILWAPTGIVNNLLWIVMFWNGHLYSSVGIQVVYILFTIYGWYEWLYGGENKTVLGISRTSLRMWIFYGIMTFLGTIILGKVLSTQTNAALAYWDTCNAIICLIAQFMLAQKKIENWYLWFVTNISYVALYWISKFYLTSAVYGLFIFLAVTGYLAWQKDYNKKHKAVSEQVLS